MSRKYRLSTALDVDDLLMECTEYAIELANEDYKFDPPMTIYEKGRWGKMGTRSDSIYPYFRDPAFYRNQPVYKGAVRLEIGLVDDVDAHLVADLKKIRIRRIVRHPHRIYVELLAEPDVALELFRAHYISVHRARVVMVDAVQLHPAAIHEKEIALYLDSPEADARLHAAARYLVIHVVEHRILGVPFGRGKIPEQHLCPFPL